MRDSRPALARHLVPAGNVDYVDYVVGQFSAVIRREVVLARERERWRERERERERESSGS